MFQVMKALFGVEQDYKIMNDVTIQAQPDEQIKNGIRFKCKFIASCEINRPTSKVEIVASMRRIRYENKIKENKKKRALMEISTEGIKVVLRKRSTFTDRNPQELVLHYYPINRIYYVAHDTTDTLIYSYIAKNDDNTFNCSVFKALSKRKTIDTVRSIGQAFEICHKENLLKSQQENNERETDIDAPNTSKDHLSILITDDNNEYKRIKNNSINGNLSTSEMYNDKLGVPNYSPMEFEILNNKFQQQIKETDALRIQMNLFKASLHVEINARTEAQVQLQNSLAHNRELLLLLEKINNEKKIHNNSLMEKIIRIKENEQQHQIQITDQTNNLVINDSVHLKNTDCNTNIIESMVNVNEDKSYPPMENWVQFQDTTGEFGEI